MYNHLESFSVICNVFENNFAVYPEVFLRLIYSEFLIDDIGCFNHQPCCSKFKSGNEQKHYGISQALPINSFQYICTFPSANPITTLPVTCFRNVRETMLENILPNCRVPFMILDKFYSSLRFCLHFFHFIWQFFGTIPF